MLSLAHTVISLPLGVFWQHPILVFSLAFVGHFLLDAIYHWNIYPPYHPKFPVFLVFLDIVGGFVIAWFVVGEDIVSLPILAAIIGGNAPDVAQTLWFLLGKPRSKRFPFLTYLFDVHDRIQWETHSVVKGLIPQLTISFLAILLIF